MTHTAVSMNVESNESRMRGRERETSEGIVSDENSAYRVRSWFDWWRPVVPAAPSGRDGSLLGAGWARRGGRERQTLSLARSPQTLWAIGALVRERA